MLSTLTKREETSNFLMEDSELVVQLEIFENQKFQQNTYPRLTLNIYWVLFCLSCFTMRFA